jgi:hypothetical protein
MSNPYWNEKLSKQPDRGSAPPSAADLPLGILGLWGLVRLVKRVRAKRAQRQHEEFVKTFGNGPH